MHGVSRLAPQAPIATIGLLLAMLACTDGAQREPEGAACTPACSEDDFCVAGDCVRESTIGFRSGGGCLVHWTVTYIDGSPETVWEGELTGGYDVDPTRSIRVEAREPEERCRNGAGYRIYDLWLGHDCANGDQPEILLSTDLESRRLLRYSKDIGPTSWPRCATAPPDAGSDAAL